MGGKVCPVEGTEPAKAPKEERRAKRRQVRVAFSGEGGAGDRAQKTQGLLGEVTLTYCPSCVSLRIQGGSLP